MKLAAALPRVSAGVIALAVVAVGSQAAGAPEVKRSPPTLRVASVQPLKVKGMRFVPHERVRVTLEGSGESATRRARASVTGSFVVSFAGGATCNGFSVRAAGNRGSRASLQFSSLLCPES